MDFIHLGKFPICEEQLRLLIAHLLWSYQMSGEYNQANVSQGMKPKLMFTHTENLNPE